MTHAARQVLRLSYIPVKVDSCGLQDESCGIRLRPEDIRVHNLNIDYTMKEKNPLEEVGFYEVRDSPLF